MSQESPPPPEVSAAARMLGAQRKRVPRICEECGEPFEATARRRYCSNTCNVRAWRRAQRALQLPEASTGRITERGTELHPAEPGSDRMTNVLLLSTHLDSMRVLQGQLQQAGYLTSGQVIQELQSGQRNYLDVLAQYEPDVIVYDLAQPYQEQWNFYELLRSSELSTPLVFILTSANKPLLEQVVGETGSLQFTDDPGSLGQLVAELQEVAAALAAPASPPPTGYPEVVVLFPADGSRAN